MNAKKLILDLSFAELKEVLEDWREPDYRATQIWKGLYSHLWKTPIEFTNLSKSLREKLDQEFTFSNLELQKKIVSNDGQTTKILLRLPAGESIEAVLMTYEKRRTLCISTQVGCSMGCDFCATGQMGFKKNLSSGEIMEQVLFYARLLHEKGEKVTNVVYMGMGEPFLNYDVAIKSIKRLNHHHGFNLGARRFTISTVGIIPKIQKFTKEKTQINLAISLHAADNDLRSSIIPINKKYPIEQLLDTCREYVAVTGRRITFEWALINNINDSQDQANKLGKLIKGMNCHVNLIPLNPTTRFNGEKSTPDQVVKFTKILEDYNIPYTVRVRRGIDIQAGCGQLASEKPI
jgi:23S rRNA (adenine2503-C2)-methyltransferase